MPEVIDPAAILAKYSAPVPRYTSYPTAPHFVDGEGKAMLPAILSGADSGERLSIYLHVPFCDRLCWFCACHTKQTNRYDPVEAYVGSLVSEMALYRQALSGKPTLAHLHLGGGSPSLLSKSDFSRLAQALHETFHIDAQTEISIEIDPNDHTPGLLEGMKALGVTRVSIGVQDFDVAVQQAINRPQTFEQTRDLVVAVREMGIGSVNIDALYGLPLQTMQRLESTIEGVASLSPDRIALFGYAHVPWMKKHQTMIRDIDLPDAITRFRQAELAGNMLAGAGYRRIGIDHFAKPGDSLAEASGNGTLRRNFQGYTTDSCQTMLAFGASSIGRHAGGYFQNLVATGQYRTSVDNGLLPLAKGYVFTRDDLVRGWVIERIMCDFGFSFEALSAAFPEEGDSIVAEAGLIANGDEDGLCRTDGSRFEVVEAARPFTRIVAARFDAHMRTTEFRYSRAV